MEKPTHPVTSVLCSMRAKTKERQVVHVVLDRANKFRVSSHPRIITCGMRPFSFRSDLVWDTWFLSRSLDYNIILSDQRSHLFPCLSFSSCITSTKKQLLVVLLRSKTGFDLNYSNINCLTITGIKETKNYLLGTLIKRVIRVLPIKLTSNGRYLLFRLGKKRRIN